MTTDSKAQIKLDWITSISTPLFTEGMVKEEIAEKIIIAGDYKAHDIGFAEVLNLVTRAGKNGGFIKTPEQRKEDLKSALKDADLAQYNDYDKFTEYVESMITEHGNAKKWTLDAIKAAFTSAGITIPKKSNLTEWQKATIEAFCSNKDITQVELDAIIKEVGVQNYSHYSNLVHGLASGIVKYYSEAMEALTAEYQASVELQVETQVNKRGKKK